MKNRHDWLAIAYLSLLATLFFADPTLQLTVTPLSVNTPVAFIDTLRILRECTATDWP